MKLLARPDAERAAVLTERFVWNSPKNYDVYVGGNGRASAKDLAFCTSVPLKSFHTGLTYIPVEFDTDLGKAFGKAVDRCCVFGSQGDQLAIQLLLGGCGGSNGLAFTI